MDKSIERIIRRVLEEARAGGRNHQAQTELAVRAVREARPDMTASDALAAVNIVRQSQLVCVSLMSPSGQSRTISTLPWNVRSWAVNRPKLSHKLPMAT
jgi:hypothetical protein